MSFIMLSTGLSAPARSQASSNQFWPEVDTYYSFNKTTRLEVVASRSTDGTSYNSIEIGPTFHFFAKRFLRPILTTPNEAKHNWLVFGVGYRYLAGINQAPENRAELDVTSQFRLPLGLQAGDRNRIDLRFVDGMDFSWRYRNRIVLQRSFVLHRVEFSPYAQGEFYYYSDSETWKKTTFQVGADFPFRKHFDFAPYYERDNNIGSLPNVVNAIGVTLSIYL